MLLSLSLIYMNLRVKYNSMQISFLNSHAKPQLSMLLQLRFQITLYAGVDSIFHLNEKFQYLMNRYCAQYSDLEYIKLFTVVFPPKIFRKDLQHQIEYIMLVIRDSFLHGELRCYPLHLFCILSHLKVFYTKAFLLFIFVFVRSNCLEFLFPLGIKFYISQWSFFQNSYYIFHVGFRMRIWLGST